MNDPSLRERVIAEMQVMPGRLSAPSLRMKIQPFPQMPDLLNVLDQLVVEGKAEKLVDGQPRPLYWLASNPQVGPGHVGTRDDPQPRARQQGTGTAGFSQPPREAPALPTRPTVKARILSALKDAAKLTSAEIMDLLGTNRGCVPSALTDLRKGGQVERDDDGKWFRISVSTVAPTAPVKPNAGVQPRISDAFAQLEKKLGSDARVEIKNLSVKAETLTRLEKLLDPSISSVLAEIRDDLMRLAA